LSSEDIHKTSANAPSPEARTPSTPEGPLLVSLDRSSMSFGTVFRVVAVTLILLFIGGFLAQVISSLAFLFFLLVVSVFFAYLIDPLVKLIRRPFKARNLERFMPRPLAILIAYVLVFTVLGVAIANIAPLVIEQGKEFGASLPGYANEIRQSLSDLNRRFDRLRVPEELQTRINTQAAALGEQITAGFGSSLISFVTYIPWFIIVPVLAFFFLKDVNLVRLAVLRVFPAGPWRMRAEAVMQDLNLTLAGYTRAQLISCLLIGTVCTIGFYILGLKYALLLGILAGIFEFVPVLGPASIGLIVITTAAFSDDPWKALYVFLFLAALRVIHDYVTYPRIVQGGVHLHPVLIILSVLAGEQVAGIPGVFLAIPLVAIGVVLYRHAVEHKGGKGLVKEMLEREPMTEAEEPRS